MVKLSDMREGSEVIVRTTFGKLNKGIVTEIEEDIKKGMPGISYDTPDNDSYWAYLDQVVRVTKY